MTLTEGASRALTATVQPADADQTVTWKTSNAAVATVSAGSVTAVAAGTATITATTVNGLTAECVVTVNPVAPKFLTDLPSTGEVAQGESFTFNVKIDRTDCVFTVEKDGSEVATGDLGGDSYSWTIDAAAESDAGVYTIVATVKNTTVKTTSNALTLTVTAGE